MKCPVCEGVGGWTEYIERGFPGAHYPCNGCNETGKVSLWWMINYWFWTTVPVKFIEWYADIVKYDKSP